MNAEQELRRQVRDTLDETGISQAEACRQLGCSTKHMNQMLIGRAPLTLGRAERILALCGRRVQVLVLKGKRDTNAMDS